ncbi:phage tail protein [Psychromonas aquimarina]|uniref:phage tail protein n=1 Tax=Psychromonas aquimarina TaxID=444919 RepID=UPI000404130E|nr:tail fiber protein [Psychromonas aquimarina]
MAEPFIGEVDLYGFNFVPQDWGQCSGGIISISSNQALFSLLGTAYGGDGRSNFALPDLRGKMAISEGNFPGSQFDWKTGQSGGAETHTLKLNELAQHAHTADFTAAGVKTAVNIEATTDNGDNAAPSQGAYLAAAKPPGGGSDKPEQIYKTAPSAGSTFNLGGINVSGGSTVEGSVSVGTTGSNTQFSLIQPTLITNYCIALKGLFPSRN